MWAFVVFAIAAAAALFEASRKTCDSRAEWVQEARISIALGALALFVDALLPDRGAPSPAGVGLLVAATVFLADDFLYYLSHRLAHRVAIFWASHAVHHSPTRYNFFTGLRQPPTWLLTPGAVAPLVLLVCGAPAPFVAACAAVRGLHHFIIHTESVRRLPGWVECVFNTPSHHRVHHASECQCLDRSFGGVLIIWDRVFGTFVPEPEQGVSRYGLVQPSGSSALRIVFDPWRVLGGRLSRATGLKATMLAACGPPASRFSRVGVTGKAQ